MGHGRGAGGEGKVACERDREAPGGRSSFQPHTGGLAHLLGGDRAAPGQLTPTPPNPHTRPGPGVLSAATVTLERRPRPGRVDPSLQSLRSHW